MPRQQKALTEEELKERAEVMALPSSFARHASKEVLGFKYETPPHILAMEEFLLPALFDDTQKSFRMVNAPPRHGKSYYCQFLIAWYLMMFPNKRAMYITYGEELSQLGGKIIKALIAKFGPRFFHVHIPKNASPTDFDLNDNPLSGLLAVGFGGGITGKGADLIVIDDLIKRAIEALSAATKRNHVNEYDASIASRLEPGGSLFCIATRWTEDDLPGTIRNRCAEPGYKGDPWEFLSFPCLAEIGEDEMEEMVNSSETNEELEVKVEAWRDQLGRKVGETLWPDRHTQSEMERIRASREGWVWNALYQQNPIPPQGGMFPKDAWKYYNDGSDEMLPSFNRRVWVWDLAFTPDDGDWSVGLLLGLTSDRRVFLLKRMRFQGHGGTVEEKVLAAAHSTGPGVPILIEQERSGSGKFVVNHFTRKLQGWTVTGVKPEGDKAERAGPLSSLVQLGGFFLPRSAIWLPEWVNEFRFFPKVRHDDQVDAAVHGTDHLLGAGLISFWSPAGMGIGAQGEMDRFLQQAGIHGRAA